MTREELLENLRQLEWTELLDAYFEAKTGRINIDDHMPTELMHMVYENLLLLDVEFQALPRPK